MRATSQRVKCPIPIGVLFSFSELLFTSSSFREEGLGEKGRKRREGLDEERGVGRGEGEEG